MDPRGRRCENSQRLALIQHLLYVNRIAAKKQPDQAKIREK
jgi:hypothetical protein